MWCIINQEVTLWQMLEAREARAERQQALLDRYGRPLICFTMNIPGPVKRTDLIRRAFDWGCRALEARLSGVLHREMMDAVTGCEAVYAVDCPAAQLKRICTALEDDTPLGRLFDMDVLDPAGRKLDRSLVGGRSRDCIVCGAPGRGCASRRVHPVSQLQAVTLGIMEAHFAPLDGAQIAALAVRSLLDEVDTTPKPGLVDRRNTGSHRDMNRASFAASARALEPYFRSCVTIGQETAALPAEETFLRLRQAGLRAEQDMYRATGGVNTHKGAIFTLGLLCGSLGRLWTGERPAAETARVLETCARMAAFSVQSDLKELRGEPATAGEALYRTRGLTGIRGEAAAGLPAVAGISLPVFRACLAEGYNSNDAGAITLIHLMASVEDTNLYHRGGPEGAAWVRQMAASLLPRPSMAEIRALDAEMIRRNLSPGGCADLLAATYFLHALEQFTP